MSEAEDRPDASLPERSTGISGPSRSPREQNRTARWARLERAWWLALIGTMVVFSAFPMANMLLGLATKDYGLWYQVGLAVRQGLDVYPRPETGRLFPVHVSPLGRGDARRGEPAGPDRAR